MSEQTRVLTVHRLRRTARRLERRLQADLNSGAIRPIHFHTDEAYRIYDRGDLLATVNIPRWMCGVRVERAGFFQWTVVATSHRGH